MPPRTKTRGPLPSAPSAPPAPDPAPTPATPTPTQLPADITPLDLPQTETTSIEYAQQMRAAVLELIKKVFVKGVHYGRIPGCDRDILLQPGAQAICWLFNVTAVPQPHVIEHDGGHRTWEGEVLLMHRVTGRRLAVGIGVCSTLESNYATRRGLRACPKCGSAAIIQTKSGPNPGGFWCAPNKGGCSADFRPEDPALKDQETGRVAHGNPADHFNKCAKMWFKRSLVHGAISLSGCSDLFTQDLDETAPPGTTPQAENAPPPQQQRQQAQARPSPAANDRPIVAKVTEPRECEAEIVKCFKTKSGKRSDGNTWQLFEIHLRREGTPNLGSITAIDDEVVAAAQYAMETKQRARCSIRANDRGYMSLMACEVRGFKPAPERRFVPDPQ